MSENKSSKGGLWALLLKFGGKIFSTIIKLSKFGLAGLSLASFTILFNWKFALLIMIAIGIHESGHVWAMKNIGIKTKGWYYIPFVGGAAIAEEQYTDYKQNVWVAIMGPAWACVSVIVAGVMYQITKNPLFAASAAWIATINLFNLLPITPLDGGQIMRAITFSINQKAGMIFLALSFLISIAIMVTLHIWLWVLLLIVGGIELGFEVYTRYKYKTKEYPNWLVVELTGHHRPTSLNINSLFATAFAYVFLVAFLLKTIFVFKHIPGADLAHTFFQ